jgi:hypothetical protein
LNVTNKLTILLALSLTLGITAVSAAHTPDVSIIDQNFVAGDSTDSYTFEVTNQGSSSDEVYRIDIEAPSDFSIAEETLSCPSGWSQADNIDSSQVACYTDAFTDENLENGESTEVSFEATSSSPQSDQEATWDVTTTDNNAGNTEDSSADVTVDVEAPSSDTSINSPKDDVTNSDSWEIESSNIQDGSSGVAEITLEKKIDSGWTEVDTVQDPSSPETFDFTPGDTNGLYEFRTVAKDEIGNTEDPSSEEASITYDSSAPSSVSVDSPTGVQNKQSSSSLEVDYSYSEENADYAEIVLLKSGEEVKKTYSDSEIPDGDKSVSYTIDEDSLPTSEGEWNLRVEVYDDAGNSNSDTKDNVLRIDDTAPVLDSATTGESASGDNNNNDDITLSFTETGSGLDSAEIAAGDFEVSSGNTDVKGVSVSDEEVTLSLGSSLSNDATPSVEIIGTLMDNAGNMLTSGSVDADDGLRPDNPDEIIFDQDSVNADNQNNIDVNVSFNDAPESGTVTLKVEDEDSNSETFESPSSGYSEGAISFTDTDLSDLNDGTLTATAKVTDDSENENKADFTASKDIQKDTSVPELGNPSTTDETDTTFTFDVIDEGNGLDISTIENTNFEITTSEVTAESFTVDSECNNEAESCQVTVDLVEAVDKDSLTVGLTSDGSISDVEGNVLNSDTVTIEGMDGVAPELESAEKVDTENIDVTITDGVDVDEETIEASDFELSPGSVGNIEVSESGTDAEVTITLSDDVNSESVEVSIDGTIEDIAGNELTSGSKTVGNMDGVAPEIKDTALEDQTDSNGVVNDGDTVRVYATVTDGTGVESVEADLSNFGAGESVTLYAEDSDSGKNWDADESTESDVYGADVTVDEASAQEGDQSADITATDSSNQQNSDSVSTGTLEVDTESPEVSSATITNSPISDSETGTSQDVTVNFDEEMDQTVEPVVDITGLSDSYSVSPNTQNGNSQGFTDSQTWKGTVTIQDDNEEATASIDVSGAEDVAGNEVGDHSQNTFEVDTKNPQKPSSAQLDPDYVNLDNQNSVGYTIQFDSEVEAGTLDVTVSDQNGNSVSPDSSVDLESGETEATGTLDLSTLNEEELDITAQATDNQGNVGDQLENTGTAHKDTNAPAAPSSVKFSDGSLFNGEYLNDEAEPASSADVTVDFSEATESGTLHITATGGDTTVSFTKLVSGSDSYKLSDLDLGDLSDGQIDLETYILDDAGNEGSSTENTNAAEKDTSDPTVDNAYASAPDTVTVEFTKDLYGSTVDDEDFEVASNTVDSVDEVEPGVVEVTLQSDIETGANHDMEIAGEIKGVAGNTAPENSISVEDRLNPELEQVQTVDSDENGYIDAVDVTFTEEVKGASDGDFTVDSYDGETVSTAEVSSDTIRVEVTEKSSYDTDATPQVTVEDGAVQDTVGNSFAGDTTVTPVDGAAPVLLHSEINNADSNSSETKVDLTFTEFVDVSGSATADLTDEEPGELKFSSQTGETVQATYYEDTNDDNTKEKAVLDTGDSPEVSGFTGVEDVDHYRQAGHDFSSYSSPATIDQQTLTDTKVDLRMTYDTSRDEYRFTATGVSDYGSKSGVVFGFDTDNDGNYDFQVDSVSSSLQPDYYGYDDQSEDKGDYIESHDYTQDNSEAFGVFYTDSGTELQNKNTFTLTVDRSKLGSEFAVNADQGSSEFFGDLDASDDAVEVTTGASEANLVVDGDSDDQNEDYDTIQNAINNAESGDTIVVRDGTYGGQSQQVGVTVDKPVELVSANGPSSTTIHAKREAIIVDSTQDVTIKGFTVTTTQSKEDNYGEYGIRVEGKSDNFKLVHNIFEDIKDEHTVSAIGVDMKGQVTSGSNVRTDSITIRNNVIRDLDIETPYSGDDQEIRAISLNERIDNAVIESNTLKNIGSTDAKDTVGIAVFEDSGSDPREGPENFEIRLNEFSSLEASNSEVVDVFIGGYETLGASHTVEKNRLENGLYRYNTDQSGFDKSSAGALNAQGNWFGTEGVQTKGSVDASYTSLNTAENSQSVDVDTFRRALSSGTNMVSFPINQGTLPVTDVTDDLSDDNDDTVWTYSNGQWKELATGSNEDDYFRGGRGYLFNMDDGSETLSVNVDHSYDQVVSGDSPSSPVSYNLTANTWNLIGSYEEFDQGTDTALDSLETPQENDKYSFIDGNSPSEIGTGEAYWAFMNGDGGYANTQ